MKKTEIRKLQLHRETLLALASSEGWKVVAGWAPNESFPSSQSNGGACCEITVTFVRD